MKFVVLLILGVAWAAYVFSWLKSRNETRSVNSISSFNKHLSTLERTSPATAGYYQVGRQGTYVSGAPTTLSAARRRRRDVLFATGGATIVTLMLTVVVGGAFVYLFLLSAALLGGYVALLVRSQHLATERRSKVLYLPTDPMVDQYDDGYALSGSAYYR